MKKEKENRTDKVKENVMYFSQWFLEWREDACRLFPSQRKEEERERRITQNENWWKSSREKSMCYSPVFMHHLFLQQTCLQEFVLRDSWYTTSFQTSSRSERERGKDINVSLSSSTSSFSSRCVRGRVWQDFSFFDVLQDDQKHKWGITQNGATWMCSHRQSLNQKFSSWQK